MKFLKFFLALTLMLVMTACPSKYDDKRAESLVNSYHDSKGWTPEELDEAIEVYCEYLKAEVEAFREALNSSSSKEKVDESYTFGVRNKGGKELENILFALMKDDKLTSSQIESVMKAKTKYKDDMIELEKEYNKLAEKSAD